MMLRMVLGARLNAQIRKEFEFASTIGKHNLHKRSNDENRSINFTTSKVMIISKMMKIFSSLEHTHAYLARSGWIKSQIEHILVSAILALFSTARCQIILRSGCQFEPVFSNKLR